MIIVAGTLRLTEAGIEAVAAAGRETVAATRAEAGCISYSFAVDLAEPDLIRIYEEWESRAALDAHGRTPHIARWREALSRVEVKGRELKLAEIGSFEPFG